MQQEVGPEGRILEGTIAELYRQGQLALSRGDLDVAQAIADQLAEHKFTGAYEIGARAHWLAGEHEDAVRLLQVGVSRFPEVAILWSYLGEYLSDLSRYEEAKEAFEKSALGVGGSRGHADLNLAIVHWRMRSYELALDYLDRIESGPPKWKVLELQTTVLVDSGRVNDASHVLEELAVARPTEATAEELALMLGLMAEAELGLGNLRRAQALAEQCLDLEGGNSRGAGVLSRL